MPVLSQQSLLEHKDLVEQISRKERYRLVYSLFFMPKFSPDTTQELSACEAEGSPVSCRASGGLYNGFWEQHRGSSQQGMDLQQNPGMLIRAGLEGYKEGSYCPLYYGELGERNRVKDVWRMMVRLSEPQKRYCRDPIILLLQPIPAHAVWLTHHEGATTVNRQHW